VPAYELAERGALAIVEDEEAESERPVEGDDGEETEVASALHQRVSRRAVAKGAIAVARTPLVEWGQVQPGVYRVSARIKFDGDTGVIGTPIRLSVALEPGHPQQRKGAYRDFSATDLGEPEAYQTISFLFEVSPQRDKRLPARSPWAMWRQWREVYPDAQVAEEEGEPPAEPEGFHLALTLPQTKYLSASGMPPNSLRWVRLDWLRMERIEPSPPITVRYVRPDKIWLRPGGEQGFAVGLENYTSQVQTRTLAVVLERGLAERQELHRETVEVSPGAERQVHVPWPTARETPLWGYKVIAEIRRGDVVESRAHDYFQIHPRCYSVHILGSNTRTVDPYRWPERYLNHQDIFGATPGDMARILPKGDAWYSGMGGGGKSVYTYKTVRARTEHNKREGIMTVLYLFAGGTGTPLMEDYVKHPEWMTDKGVATDPIYRINHAWGEQVRLWDWEKKGLMSTEDVMVPHIEMHMNHRFPELKQRIEQELLEFVRRTGYEGVRFDVGIMGQVGGAKTVLGTAHSVAVENPMAHAAKNFNDLRAVIEAEFPDFEWGANMDTWGYLDTIKDRDIPPEPAEEYDEFVAFCRAGGMFMDEGTMNAPYYDHYMNTWEDCWYFMNLKRAITRRFGGVYELFSPHRDGSGHFCHDDIYFALMIIASGSHYVGSFAAPPYSEESMGAFATRFSEFFWHHDLSPLEDAVDRVFVDAPADIWYAEGAVQQEIGPGVRYVVPLINPPVVERLRRNKVNELPPPIEEDFPIEITMPDGMTRAVAWMLTWEPRVEARKLACEVTDDICTVTFPGVKIFRTLVVEFTP